jgi:hypothetical protein
MLASVVGLMPLEETTCASRDGAFGREQHRLLESRAALRLATDALVAPTLKVIE